MLRSFFVRRLHPPRPNEAKKEISSWEALFNPLRQTSQERWFYEECIAPERTKRVIVSNFRGCGKTTTITRLQWRWFLYPRLWLTRRIEFYDSETVNSAFPTSWDTIASQLASYIFLLILSIILALAGLWYTRPERDPKKPHWVALREVVDEQLSTKEGVFLMVSIWIFQFLFRRRRVLILDDVSQTKNHSSRMFLADSGLLSGLAALEKSANVIFVSSHEMMRFQFVDTSSTVFVEKEMPPLTTREMELRLSRMDFDILDALGKKKSPVDGEKSPVEEVAKMYGVQLAYSGRFYLVAKECRIPLLAPTRAHLFKFCFDISLEATDKSAIVCSKMVSVDTLEHFPLAGCITKEALAEGKNALHYFKEAFPKIEMVPHRLIIPMILAATSHVSNVPDESEMYTLMLDKLPERGAYAKIVLPKDAVNAVGDLQRKLEGMLQLALWTTEFEYFYSLFDKEERPLLDKILAKYGKKGEGDMHLYARMFGSRRKDVLDALREEYPSEEKGRCEVRISEFETWMGKQRK